MAEVKWIKIVTDIFDDEKILLIESMPDADAVITIWFKLLCLAGKQNNHGVFVINDSIPFTDEMFATIFRRKVTTVRMALDIFEKFGMVTIIDGVVTIPNWEKHQSLDALENKKEYMREYMRKRRESQKLLAESACKSNSKTNSNDNCKTNSKANVSCLDKNRLDKKENKNNISSNADAFERIWKEYPRKEGHKEAKAAFERAVKHGAKIEDIEKGVLNYKEHILKNKIEKQYIKQGSTYFRQEAWNDVYDDSPVTQSRKKSSYDINKLNIPFEVTKASYDINKFEEFANTFDKEE